MITCGSARTRIADLSQCSACLMHTVDGGRKERRCGWLAVDAHASLIWKAQHLRSAPVERPSLEMQDWKSNKSTHPCATFWCVLTTKNSHLSCWTQWLQFSSTCTSARGTSFSMPRSRPTPSAMSLAAHSTSVGISTLRDGLHGHRQQLWSPWGAIIIRANACTINQLTGCVKYSFPFVYSLYIQLGTCHLEISATARLVGSICLKLPFFRDVTYCHSCPWLLQPALHATHHALRRSGNYDTKGVAGQGQVPCLLLVGGAQVAASMIAR